MHARLTAMYMIANSNQTSVPIHTYTLSGPLPGNGSSASTKPSAIATTIANNAWKWTALTGDLKGGWTGPNQRGRSVARPIANSDRVAAVAPAFAFARQLFRIART